MNDTADTMPFEELEAVYERIAETIDSLPEEQQDLFLAKLCLALAHRVSDSAEVNVAISEAAQSLETSPKP